MPGNASATPPSNRRRSPSLAALAQSGGISDAFFSRDIVPSWGGHLDFFAQTLDGFVGNNPTHAKGAPPEEPGLGVRLEPRREMDRPGHT